MVMTACTRHGFSYLALQEGVLDLLSPGRWTSGSIMVKMKLEKNWNECPGGKEDTFVERIKKKSPPLVAPSWQLLLGSSKHALASPSHGAGEPV